MAFTTAFPTSFKGELPQGMHNFTTGGHSFKVALGIATPAGTFGPATTNYSQLGTDEVPNGNGYATGGFPFAAGNNITPATDPGPPPGAFWQWNTNPTWPLSTFSTSGCLIYNTNTSPANKVVYVGYFGGTQTVSGGTLTLIQPANARATSLLQLN